MLIIITDSTTITIIIITTTTTIITITALIHIFYILFVTGDNSICSSRIFVRNARSAADSILFRRSNQLKKRDEFIEKKRFHQFDKAKRRNSRGEMTRNEEKSEKRNLTKNL